VILDAILSAYNEAATVAAVVRVVREAGVFRVVRVVDDGSTDDTSRLAREAGATVLRLAPNRGKGQAMRAGVEASRGADAVAFFDADLLTLTAAHVRQLVAPVVARTCLMTCGIQDYGGVYNALQAALPPITGQRVVAWRVLERVPATAWQGFRTEVSLNVAAEVEFAARPEGVGRATCLEVLAGLTVVPKWHKVGAARGLEQAADMMIEVLVALRDAHAAIG